MISLDGVRNAPGLFHLRRHRYRVRFLNEEFGTFWGRFQSFDDALASLPLGKASSYHNEDLVTFHVHQFLQVLPFDWPVLFFLSRGLADGGVWNFLTGSPVRAMHRPPIPASGLQVSAPAQVTETKWQENESTVATARSATTNSWTSWSTSTVSPRW